MGWRTDDKQVRDDGAFMVASPFGLVCKGENSTNPKEWLAW